MASLALLEVLNEKEFEKIYQFKKSKAGLSFKF